MFKKLFLVILIMTATLGFAQETEFKTINNLIYHKSMFNASESIDLLKIPFGSETSQVGGQDQDADALSYGVPWAFRMAEGGNVWVLDSLNRQLKLFKPDATVEKNFSLEGFGKIVIDFAVAADGRMAFLNSADGFIYITDAKGEKVHSIEGFNGARAIEFDRNGELLVSHPVIQSVLKFGQNGELVEQMVGDQSLSLYSDSSGKLFGLEIADLEASLYLRTVASPAETLVIGKFPYTEKHPGVTYAGGEILGLDAAGNVYFCLVACHEEGQIYRERLYRCAPDGKVLGELDIHTIPHLAPDLPRKRVVCPDGRVMGFYPTEEHFVLCTYTIP